MNAIDNEVMWSSIREIWDKIPSTSSEKPSRNVKFESRK